MRTILVAAVLLAICPLGVSAQANVSAKPVAPESLLPARCLAFFRYDGYDAHRQAYDKTVLAKVMNDDLGEFIDHVLQFAKDALIESTLQPRGDEKMPAEEKKGEQPKKENNPPAAKREPLAALAKKAAAQFPGALQYLWRHGIVVSLEIPDVNRWQLHVVFPEGGAPRNRAVLLPLLQLVGEMNDAKTRTVRLQGRTISWQTWRPRNPARALALAPPLPPGQDPLANVAGAAEEERRLAWWQEGEHIVLTVGTESFESLLRVSLGHQPSAADALWHRALAKFNSYETDMRGYVDLEQAIEMGLRTTESGAPLALLLERPLRGVFAQRLGLRGLKSLSFHLGFAGKHQRSTIQVATVPPKERQGVLKLLSSPLELDLDQLPPLPADADVVDFHRIDFARVYDELTDLARTIAAATALQRGNLDFMPGDVWDLDQLVGINTRKDLLGSVDSKVILYGAHTEGPFLLGAAALVKVKDQRKLERALENLQVVMAQRIGQPGIKFEKRMYRGVAMHVMQGAPVAPTYAVHQDWLVMALYPQPVMGLIGRSQGRRAVWKVPPEVREALAAAEAQNRPGSKLAAVWVTDPRRSIDIGLSILPAAATVATSQLNRGPGQPKLTFDIAKIPPARAVTEHLFSNVDMFFDDGDAFRLESQFSIDLPLGCLLLVPYSLAIWDFF